MLLPRMGHQAFRNVEHWVWAVASAVVLAVVPWSVSTNAGAYGAIHQAVAGEQGLVSAVLADEDPTQVYGGFRYVWLGRYQIVAEISGLARTGFRIRLMAGAKNDRRGFVAQWFEGEKLIDTKTVEYGGYDGFRELELHIPHTASSRLTLRLLPGGPRPAFFSSLTMVATEGASTSQKVTPQVTIKLVRIEAAAPVDGGFAAAYPEMAAVWLESTESPEAVEPGSEEWAFRVAAQNGRKSHEMFFRAFKYMEGWLAHADPKTGLIPRNLTVSRDLWNPEDAAADNYPFLVLTAFVTNQELFRGKMLEMLHTETRLTSRLGALPDAWSFSRHGFARPEPSLPALIFGGSEYVKDGLLPLAEFLGPSPWLERLIAIEDSIWEHASIESPYGPLPSDNVEVNGEQLQALARIYWLTGNRKYLNWAMRLGDYYLLGNRPPTRDFDALRLRDHGCEIVSGLCELYVAVSFADKAKAEAYRAPIHEMCDKVLQLGRDSRGMMYNVIYPKKGTHDPNICDTWGYNYNGIYSVYLVDKVEEYREAVRFVLGNLLDQVADYHWGSADEYADSIEGAINLYNREPIPSAAAWIDRKIHDMWKPQRPDGVIEGWHGDGNVARTALMYAFWKTQGLRVEPWRPDLRLGAVFHNGRLYVSLASSQPWQGRLIFDRPRHRHYFHLPIDYPRINQFPEWFTIDENEQILLEERPQKDRKLVSAAVAWRGVEVVMTEPGERRWIVTKQTQ